VKRNKKPVSGEEEVQLKMDGQQISLAKEAGKKHLTGSVAAKLVAFVLSGVSFFAGFMGIIVCGNMMASSYYRMDLQQILLERLSGKCRDVVYSVRYYLAEGDAAAVEAVCKKQNIEIEFALADDSNRGKVLWGTWEDNYDTQLIVSIPVAFSSDEVNGDSIIGGSALKADQDYLVRFYIDPEFPIDDDFRIIARVNTWIYENRYVLIGVAAGAVLLWLACFLFLMCSAGHRNGCAGIVPGVLTGIYLDVLSVGVGVVAIFLLFCIVEAWWMVNDYIAVPVIGFISSILAAWVTLYLMEFALRVKAGKWWRHSLVYVILQWMMKIMGATGRGIMAVMKGLPTILATLLFFAGVCLLEFIGLARYTKYSGAVLLWGMEKIVLLAIVLYLALVCKKLLYASRALADGQEDYVVDTSWMFGDFKEHGENLNSLGRGISKAVAERTKSEHLKTELITNVSHDLKTPLTSIINYADLICEESRGMLPVIGENGNSSGESKIAEYAEVLLRQSRRLKKLLEDLVDASKATTGNVEVHLEPCEAGVLLIQAVGEYQKKMEDKGLELIARQPDEPVKIMADGRHLWRVFDNLLNNICKYAQENTRVYLSVEETEGKVSAEEKLSGESNVRIVFRNMSKYPLEISPEELEERFVRGDKSRHMEGNGLGLSIAKSLIDLQGGRMDIVTDGDLFKVTLTFKRISI